MKNEFQGMDMKRANLPHRVVSSGTATRQNGKGKSVMNEHAPKISIRFLKYLSIGQFNAESDAEGNGHAAGSGKPAKMLSGIALR